MRYGAVLSDSPTKAVMHAQVVLTMLAEGVIVSSVINQIIESIPADALVIDMSSTAQSEALALHRLLAERGLNCLDAPVSRGVLGAATGDQAIMVGGTKENFPRALPLFDVLGHATLVGGAGAGQVAKLCNQLIVGGTLNLVAEALLLAESAGADPTAVRRALRGGFAESRILEVHGQRMLDRDFRPGGQIKSQLKDLENVLQAAAAVGLNLPLAELVSAHYGSILSTLATADQAAILLALEQVNPGRRLGTAEDKMP